MPGKSSAAQQPAASTAQRPLIIGHLDVPKTHGRSWLWAAVKFFPGLIDSSLTLDKNDLD